MQTVRTSFFSQTIRSYNQHGLLAELLLKILHSIEALTKSQQERSIKEEAESDYATTLKASQTSNHQQESLPQHQLFYERPLRALPQSLPFHPSPYSLSQVRRPFAASPNRVRQLRRPQPYPAPPVFADTHSDDFEDYSYSDDFGDDYYHDDYDNYYEVNRDYNQRTQLGRYQQPYLSNPPVPLNRNPLPLLIYFLSSWFQTKRKKFYNHTTRKLTEIRLYTSFCVFFTACLYCC